MNNKYRIKRLLLYHLSQTDFHGLFYMEYLLQADIFCLRISKLGSFHEKNLERLDSRLDERGVAAEKKIAQPRKKILRVKKKKMTFVSNKKSISIPDFLCLFVAALSHFFQLGQLGYGVHFWLTFVNLVKVQVLQRQLAVVVAQMVER